MAFDAQTATNIPFSQARYAAAVTYAFFENNACYKNIGYLSGGIYTNTGSDAVTVLFPSVRPAAGSPIKVVGYFHGAGNDGQSHITDAASATSTQRLLHQYDKDLLQDGWFIISSDGGTNTDHWGNPASWAATTNALAWLQSIFNVYKVASVGQSMGGLSSMRFAAQWVGAGGIVVSNCYEIYPVLNLTFMGTNSIFSSIITNSFGGTAAWNANKSACDPMQFTLSQFLNKRISIIASLSDTIVNITNNSIAFSNRVAGTAISCKITTATGNHGDQSHFPNNKALLNWINQ
jgi:S-formylglutathione hydrolase FrmB